MRLRINSFVFPDNSCEVTSSGEVVPGDDGTPLYLNASLSVTCYLTSGLPTPVLRQQDLAQQELRVRSLLSGFPLNAVLLCDNGSPSSLQLLQSPQSIEPPRCVAVSAPVGTGPQFASYRTISFTLAASYQVRDDYLVSFTETVQFTGNGGPRTVMRENLDGPPVKQVVYPNTVCRATQTGQAVGFLSYPDFGGPGGAVPPIWPDALINPDQAVSLVTPQRKGGTYTNYAVSWAYQFESEVPFDGVPTLWTA